MSQKLEVNHNKARMIQTAIAFSLQKQGVTY